MDVPEGAVSTSRPLCSDYASAAGGCSRSTGGPLFPFRHRTLPTLHSVAKLFAVSSVLKFVSKQNIASKNTVNVVSNP